MSVILPRRVRCDFCPLRSMHSFRPFSEAELAFVTQFKRGDLVVEAGNTILTEGAPIGQLFTLLSGWAFRYKTLSDGRRQILNYCLPGDLIGLQGTIMGAMEHAVEALSPAVLCVFQREWLADLYREHPGLGFDITWLAAREERMLDEHLLSVGRRSALERAAYLVAFLYERARSVGLNGKPVRLLIPITQQHVADTLGLSIVHTNKTLKKLADQGLITWHERACEVRDAEGLRHLARWTGLPETPRPLI